MRELGVSHVPEDRHSEGLVLQFQAFESVILGYENDKKLGNGLFTKPDNIQAYCSQLQESFDVRPQNPLLYSSQFSGGNQQKLVLSREISSTPKILLVGQPTRGVDIGAIEFIHKTLVSMRNSGCAILLVSVELEEILTLSDRILVMFDGKIMGEKNPVNTNEKELGLLMAGVSEKAAQ